MDDVTILDNKSLLIFDCDGVLFYSHEANIAYFDQCFDFRRLPSLKKEQHEKVIYIQYVSS